jgi:succinyl-CoA synthetase beta subunit
MMKIHEYQARRLLAVAGVPIPPGEVAGSVGEAVEAFGRMAGRVVVKAQVFAGGRGKAGFVKVCQSAEEVRAAAEFMLTHRMVSPQTGAEGVAVRRLLITEAVEIAREYYVGMTIDRTRRAPVVMVSRQGGVEIEQVAARDPQAIVKEWLDPGLGAVSLPVDRLVGALGLAGEHARSAEKVLRGLAEVFLKYDGSLAEINPLVLTTDGKLLAIDAKIDFDDNALFRHPEIAALADESAEHPNEIRARRAGLTYIALDGDIGCVVNGAGLAMATMDLIKLHGGSPANFLDVGGAGTREGAIEAFRILLAEPKVRSVLVNIFGGIAKCDLIAEALVAAAREVGFRIPVVVRLEGTNVERARAIIAEAAIAGLVSAGDMTDAARKACAAV